MMVNIIDATQILNQGITVLESTRVVFYTLSILLHNFHLDLPEVVQKAYFQFKIL